MEHITATVKIQILPSQSEKVLLDNTISVYRNACNFVSDYVFCTHDLKQFSLNKALYSNLRELFGLKSQMTQSVFKTVIARYKTVLENRKEWLQPFFRKPEYDLVWNRDYSLTKDCFSVNTLNGRVKLSYVSKGMLKYFDHTIYKFGTAKLVNKHDKYYLYIPVTYDVEESDFSNICNVVGIDRGVNFIVTTYDSKRKSTFVNGRAIKQRLLKYSKLREQLQLRKTPSARRKLKAVSQRENRWIRDVNHCVSKALVESNPQRTLFVLENLSGFHDVEYNTCFRSSYNSVSWRFYDFEQKLIYKAKQNQSIVIKVNPFYTSQCCPVCGHIEKNNRDKRSHLFVCRTCGYQSNDDRIGAMNLYRMGINYIVNKEVPDTVVYE